MVLLAALLSTICLSAQPSHTTPTIGPASPTTIGPYSPPKQTGVPDWVYSSRVAPDLRARFEVLYEMLKQRLGYQPSTGAKNFQKLADELGDIGASGAIPPVGAPGAPATVPEWVWHLDDSDQIKWLQDRIRQNVKENHLEDIALSEDLVPSLRPARPTTIGPAPPSKQLSPDEVNKLLLPAAKDAAKPVDAPRAPSTCSELHAQAVSERAKYRHNQDLLQQAAMQRIRCRSKCDPLGRRFVACLEDCSEIENKEMTRLQGQFDASLEVLREIEKNKAKLNCFWIQE